MLLFNTISKELNDCMVDDWASIDNADLFLSQISGYRISKGLLDKIIN